MGHNRVPFLCEGIAVDRHLLVRCLCYLFIVVAARKLVFLVFNTRAERLTLRRIGVFNIDAASKKIEAAMIADVDLNKMAQPTRCETKAAEFTATQDSLAAAVVTQTSRGRSGGVVATASRRCWR
jgi:hypothetical protein